MMNNNYYNYYQNRATLIEKNTLELIVNVVDLDKITKNNELLISKDIFNYKVKTITPIKENALLVSVTLSVNLPDEHNIDNNVFYFEIILAKKNILEDIAKIMKGE